MSESLIFQDLSNKMQKKNFEYLPKCLKFLTAPLKKQLMIPNLLNCPFKVSEARKRKNRRLKQAKEEAQQEIEKYKQERERTFK